MLYEIVNGERRKTTSEQMRPDAFYVGLISVRELNAFARAVGIQKDLEELCFTDDPAQRNLLMTFPDFSLGLLDVIEAENILGPRDRIAFLVQKNLFLVADIEDVDGSTAKAVEKALVHAASLGHATLEKIACDLLTSLTRNDEILLDKMEDRLAELDEEVLRETAEDCNEAIGHIRRELLVLHGYYRHLWRIGEELCANENELFDPERLPSLRQFGRRCERLVENVQLLRDLAQQVRETYQAVLDLRQNNIMRIFTVVTTVFLPLTLLTGWYGMNFSNMPELGLPWAYPVVIGVSLGIVGVCLYWFRKKRLL